MVAFTPLAQALDSQLSQLGRDFICTASLPAASVQLRFLGPFRGDTVVWEMRLGTLADWRNTAGNQSSMPCPFIEITEGVEGIFPIKVGLDLVVIDEPVIRKTIIMVRNYKRLVIGKIEFCPPPSEG